MCGRAAQTVHSIHIASNSFGVPTTSRQISAGIVSHSSEVTSDLPRVGGEERNNYNLSPGMDAAVIWMENGELTMDRKV